MRCNQLVLVDPYGQKEQFFQMLYSSSELICLVHFAPGVHLKIFLFLHQDMWGFRIKISLCHEKIPWMLLKRVYGQCYQLQ